MSLLLERFLRYVRIDTQSDETSRSVPSTAKQLDLCRLLEHECDELGLQDVSLDEHGIVMATIPATMGAAVPVIAWLAHVDTSPETTGTNVDPQVIQDYRGGDIVLPADPTKVIRVEDNPALRGLIGKTLVTTDGTTLLGADDKSGIAVIMTAAAYLMEHPEVAHGAIRVCFTCDEEIGRGVDHLDLQKLGAVCAYTLDGDGQGGIDSETFSADQAVLTVTGINIHPSIGKGKMVNAIRILSEFLAELPSDRLSPETTADREGFIHPYQIEGGVALASARMILRDFETPRLAEYAADLEAIAAKLRIKHPRAEIQIAIHNQYRNMRDGLEREPRALPKAIEATEAAGLKPDLAIIRGGTDGSRLTELGLPTPNLSTGEHNPHSPLEWTCVEEMENCAKVLVELARAWSTERSV
jgi:tripeptide aminopeptidase